MPFLRNSLDFAFDSELLMQAAYFGFRFQEVPCATMYFDEASVGVAAPGDRLRRQDPVGGRRLVLHRNGIWRSRKFMR